MLQPLLLLRQRWRQDSLASRLPHGACQSPATAGEFMEVFPCGVGEATGFSQLSRSCSWREARCSGRKARQQAIDKRVDGRRGAFEQSGWGLEESGFDVKHTDLLFHLPKPDLFVAVAFKQDGFLCFKVELLNVDGFSRRDQLPKIGITQSSELGLDLQLSAIIASIGHFNPLSHHL